jgi:hypothetical protein
VTKRQHKHPLLVVTGVVLMILALRFSSFIWPKTTRVDPHIHLAEDRLRQIGDHQRQQQIAAFVAVTEGEVFRTEERIREAIALATATSLFAARESLNRRAPASVAALLDGINNARLIPPGLQVSSSDGAITSSHSKLVVRYRPDPLGIEVISLGKVPLDGPALLVRVPSDGNKKDAANLYLATSLEQITLPNAFAREAEIFALGFASEPLRSPKVSKP